MKINIKKYLTETILSAVIIAAVVISDLVTKSYVAENALSWVNREIVVIEGFFSIHYVTNTGAAFSFAAGCDNFYSIIIPITFVLLAGILAALFWPTDKRHILFSVGLSLVFGGTLGNLVDRMSLGYVRDFLDFIIFGWDFAVFNVADAALCVGAAVIIVWIIFVYGKEVKEEKSE